MYCDAIPSSAHVCESQNQAHGLVRFADTSFLSYHAQSRMGSRGISARAVIAVLTYGRVVYARGAHIHAIGRKEVQRFSQRGIDLSEYEGIQVVCRLNGSILTLYRNRNFRSLRPRRRRWGRRRWAGRRWPRRRWAGLTKAIAG